MRRRTYLTTTGAALIGLAGCIGQASPDSEPTDEGPDPTDSPTPRPTDSPTPAPTAEFELVESTCGQGENAASITADGEALTVEGTIGGANTCEIAELADLSVVDGTLIVTVATTMPETDGTPVCGQCLTDIDYRVVVTMGERPTAVRVRHEAGGDPITVADRAL